MATAKRLPSGNWRVRIYSHTDENGKKHQESFTAPTKKEAELKAAEWQNKKDRRKKSDLTVYEAVNGYIEAKSGVLSPSTIRGYDRMMRNNIDLIKNKPIKKLTSEDLQVFVSKLSTELSPKTVRNVYVLVSSALSFYDHDAIYRVTLPAAKKRRQESPTSQNVMDLFNAASPELKKCIALAAFGSLRRGEICALTYSDLNENNTVTVSKDIVQDKNKDWIEKGIPKTSDSYRDAPIPHKIMVLLGEGEPGQKVIKYKNPDSISSCFARLRDSMGLNIHIRFHDLRHYYASIGAALGIPDIYLSDFGGWKRGSGIMKSVYQNSMKPLAESYGEKMAGYFDDMI